MSLANVTPKKRFFEFELPWLQQDAARFIVLIIICIGMAFVTWDDKYGFVFLNLNNIANVIRNASVLIILGIGQTIVLITKDVDLSIGSIVSLTSVVAAIMMNRYDIAFPLAMVMALLIGSGLGLVNGVLITLVGIPPFIATFGMLWVLFGFAYLILQGSVLYGFPETFRVIGNGHLFGIPMPIIVMLVVFAVAFVLVNKTTLGRRMFATGANEEAALMSGIKVKQTIIIAYVISGFLAALAGLVLIAYTNGSEARIGEPFLLSVIAIVVMGGTSLHGGQGSLIGTLVAAMIMAVIRNGMNLLAVPATWHNLVVGVMIIGTVLVDQWVCKKA